MPISYYLPVLFLTIFGSINLVGIRPDLIIRHGMIIVTALVIFFTIRTLKIKAQVIRHSSHILYVIFVVLLIIVYYFGKEVNGSRRWIEIFGFQIQPSEFIKLVLILLLSTIFAKYNPLRQKNYIFAGALTLTLIPFFLIYKQPDLGTAMVLASIFFVMSLLSQIPKKQILIFVLTCLLLLPFAWFTFHDYQKDRILAFFDPKIDARSTSYNMIQATISVGSGKFLGNGLGMGKQSQLYFLPEYHTDFAFSSFVEQFGFVGSAILVILYLLMFIFLLKRMLLYSNETDEMGKFKYYYIVGVSALLVFQTAVNIGMNIGLLPIAGITLPFVSYGGSSLLTFLIALAFVP